MAKRVEIPFGTRFGRLSVVGRAIPKPGQRNKSVFVCLCDCGNQTTVASSSLRRGATKSCGCINTEKLLEDLKAAGIDTTWDGKKRDPQETRVLRTARRDAKARLADALVSAGALVRTDNGGYAEPATVTEPTK